MGDEDLLRVGLDKAYAGTIAPQCFREDLQPIRNLSIHTFWGEIDESRRQRRHCPFKFRLLQQLLRGERSLSAIANYADYQFVSTGLHGTQTDFDRQFAAIFMHPPDIACGNHGLAAGFRYISLAPIDMSGSESIRYE